MLPAPTLMTSVGTSEPRMLPVPTLVSTAKPTTTMASSFLPVPSMASKPTNTVSYSVAPAPKKRITKVEKVKLAKSESKERVAGFIEGKPEKKDVAEYMRSRISELSD